MLGLLNLTQIYTTTNDITNYNRQIYNNGLCRDTHLPITTHRFFASQKIMPKSVVLALLFFYDMFGHLQIFAVTCKCPK